MKPTVLRNSKDRNISCCFNKLLSLLELLLMPRIYYPNTFLVLWKNDNLLHLRFLDNAASVQFLHVAVCQRQWHNLKNLHFREEASQILQRNLRQSFQRHCTADLVRDTLLAKALRTSAKQPKISRCCYKTLVDRGKSNNSAFSRKTDLRPNDWNRKITWTSKLVKANLKFVESWHSIIVEQRRDFHYLALLNKTIPWRLKRN